MKLLSVFVCFLSVLSSFAEVSLVKKKITGDMVQSLIDSQQFRVAREVAFQCANKQKDSQCEYLAGLLALNGKGGEQDEALGIDYVLRSARQENALAQSYVARAYFNGVGLEKSIEEGMKWWVKSAQNCNAFAQNALASFYFSSDYINSDYKKAFYWINLAAYYRFPDSDKGVTVIGKKVTKEEKDLTLKKVAEFKQSSRCGEKDRPVFIEEQ